MDLSPWFSWIRGNPSFFTTKIDVFRSFLSNNEPLSLNNSNSSATNGTNPIDSPIARWHIILSVFGIASLYAFFAWKLLRNTFLKKLMVPAEFNGLRKVYAIVLFFLSTFNLGCSLVIPTLPGVTQKLAFLPFWILFVLLHLHVFGLFTLRLCWPHARPSLYHGGVYLNLLLLIMTVDLFIRPFCYLQHPPLSVMPKLVWVYVFSLGLSHWITCISPRVWYPMNPGGDSQASDEQVCSMLDFQFTYGFLNKLVGRSMKHELELEDMPPLPDYDENVYWHSRFQRFSRPSLFKTIVSMFRWQFLGIMAVSVFVSFAQFFSLIAMNHLLRYLEGDSKEFLSPYLWILMLLVAPYVSSLAFQNYLFLSTRFLVRCHTALVQELLLKVLRFRFVRKAGADSKIGRVNNLISTDIEDIFEMRELFHVAVRAPLEIGVAVYALQKLLGWSAYVGLFFSIVTTILPIALSRLVAKLTQRANAAADSRIELTSELLQSIRITKYFGWEAPMVQRINRKRSVELSRLWRVMVVDLSLHVLIESLPLFSMFITFIVFTKLMGRDLTPSIAFTSIGLFSVIRNQFAWCAYILREIIQIFVSIDRVEDFLHDNNEVAPTSKFDADDDEVGFKNATFAWSPNPSKEEFMLKDLSVTFPKGRVTLIVGPTGAGKSSILSALLGELNLISGSYSLPRLNGVSYVPQVTWLRNDTVRENILFGHELDEQKYNEVVKACGLEPDFATFAAGDMTEIGEKGVTLSGGQKQRISLARAVYAPSDVLLIDDVFSALDVSTSNWIFENCFKGPLMKDRTVILVTHNLHLTKSIASLILTTKNGSVFPLEDFSSPLLKLAEVAEPEKVNDSLDEETGDENSQGETGSGKLVEEEQRATGSVSMKLLFEYILSFGSSAYVALVLLFIVTTGMMSIFTNLWVAFWTNNTLSGSRSNGFYLGIYGLLVLLYFLVDIFRGLAYNRGTWRAAKHVHNYMVNSVFGTYSSWFDKTPVGRIINRFSRDMRALDTTLPLWLQYTAECFVTIFGSIFTVSSVMPVFLLPTTIVCIASYIIGTIYSRAQVSIKRLMSVYTSPIFSLLGETISGLPVIRAFERQHLYSRKSSKLLDNLIRIESTSYNLNRWVAIRTEGISGIVGFIAGFIALARRNVDPGLVGFSLNQAVTFSLVVITFVRVSNNLQAELNSYQRAKEYCDLPQEPKPAADGVVPVTWPSEGDIEFKNLCVRYMENSPDVIHNLNLHVQSGEKVAIVGRTGSGKSTLGLSLLRFTLRSSGTILINGRDIETINLDALRQRISFIPQEPILFSGTIRSNLDPFNELDDAILNEALKTSGVSELTTSIDENGVKRVVSLDTPVASEGANFSQGEKQIIALARAIVRRSKIIILDECTASVDDATDQQIQKTLRHAFGNATMLCIAHRLKTIVDYDKVMVMENGCLVEYGRPADLYHNGSGTFRRMCEGSGLSF
ncbi:ATP-binding cassette transporter abc1 [Schizosaccharomyces japonicus yFS275]|uniref:ATP-binding cassette transporter abc1 n=1 Tax=Schizosaccharomyces japonicus (strain yFS275 / FY16936) TaxID=402676 RepID=B6JX98_SCHJY|nr:ATP-binding cassette transporter abc1 [Schizosaccharomyces japonicus yFS275]EEB05999.1 ATP-binding cassette transporter abc1 [Schizosaccharomyces japonicus yFS275]